MCGCQETHTHTHKRERKRVQLIISLDDESETSSLRNAIDVSMSNMNEAFV